MTNVTDAIIRDELTRNSKSRVRCRNTRCRSKLPVPTDNDHKAFCTPYCYDQFYSWLCLVCEKPIPRGRRRVQPKHCHARDCRLSFRRFPETFLYPKKHESITSGPGVKQGSGSAHFAGVKNAHNGLRRVIAGPPLSDFSLWAATLDPPKLKPAEKPSWRCGRQPGDLAAEWTARELARREADDAEYTASDAERLRTEPVDLSGNYARQQIVGGAP
jgi:hypothetical protein